MGVAWLGDPAFAATPATVVEDPFTDSSHTNTTGGDPLGLVWYRNATSGATLAVADDVSVAPASKALVLTASSTFRGMLAFFPTQTLASSQVLTLSFDFRFTTAPVDNSQSFRFGVYNSNGTRQSGDATSATRLDDYGYGIYTNVGADNSAATRVFVESAGDDTLGGAVPSHLRGLAAGGNSYACGTGARHSARLRITRLANGNVYLEGRIDNGKASSGTITAAADQIYAFDMIALTNGGAAPSQSLLIDNVTVTVNTPPTVTLTAPTSNSAATAPAAFSLAAAASDSSAVAKVEFYRGTTKIGEDTLPPYTFDWSNVGPGVHSLTAVAIDDDGETATSAAVDVRVTGGTPDEYDALRARWLRQITGGTGYSMADPEIAGRVAAITSSAQTQWNNLVKTGGNSRAHLWSDAASTTLSSHISTCYTRLRAMALAYGTTGSSLQGNTALLADIESALDWMNANRYHENITPYDNWYDWEIGSPQRLNDIVVLLYDQLPATRLMNQMRAIERFVPTADTVTFTNAYNTGANRTDKDCVVAVRGVLVKDSAKLFAARDSLSPVFQYVTDGDGYYTDGSFIQHNAHPYNGGYGTDLIDGLSLTLDMLNGSTWAVVDPNVANVYRWIYDSYEPILFRGALMDCMRGRSVSRNSSEDHLLGHDAISSILRIAEFAPATDAQAFKQMTKALIQADTARNFVTTASLPAVLRAKSVLENGAIIPRPDLATHRHFAGMDRVVHHRPGFAFTLSMSSSRIYGYESINSENLHGWYQGEGASYLYNSDIDEYSSGYWPTVNSYRLAGITVDTRARTNGEGQSTFNGGNWVGGAEILDLYGSAGFELAASGSTLTARKSWFMFDDEIVALGSGINSTDNRTIETIVENRRLKIPTSALTADGVAKSTALGWNETMSNVGWAHLAATGGYVFPGGATIKGLRETRTGAWRDINAGGPTATVTNNYATLWFDHGSNPTGAGYAYIMLPNQSSAQTSAYASAPGVVILENTTTAHAVRDQSLGITAMNLWEDATHTAGLITGDKKSAILVREAATQMDISVADPTQLNTGFITVELGRASSGLVSSDARITVLQLTPVTRFTADLNGALGQTIRATFTLPDTTAPTIATPVGGFTPLTLGAGTALPNYTVQAIVGDNIGVTGVTQVPAVGTLPNAGVVHITLTAHDAAGNTADVGFDVVVWTAGESWRQTYFGTTANAGSAADAATPDRDGISNLMKYALVIAPGNSAATLLPVGQNLSYAEGRRLSLTIHRDPARNDILVEVQAADNVAGPWTTVASSSNGAAFTGAGFVSETPGSGSLKVVQVRDVVNLADWLRRFMRVKVTR